MLQHRYTGTGQLTWRLEVSLGDASCPREGQLLVCDDPRCYRWRPAASMGTGRAAHAAVALADGRVLVSGGADWSLLGSVTAEILDPATLVFSPVSALAEPRLAHQATLLADGTVLVTGGATEVGDDLGLGLGTVERFAPPPARPARADAVIA